MPKEINLPNNAKRPPIVLPPRTKKNQAPPDKPKRSLIEIFIAGGIIAMAMAMAVSLFAYYRPFSWKDVVSVAQSLQGRVSACIAQIQGKDPDSGNPDPALLETQEPVPYIDRTADMGEISSFSSGSVFPPQEDSVYSCMLDTAMGPLLYYNQGDVRWKNYLYGGSDPIGSYGCGPVCVSMIINSFTTTSCSPVEIADWAVANGCYASHSGSYHCLIFHSLTAFGLQVESVTDRSLENATELLRSRHILVALMGKGSLTQNGHFIIIAQLGDNGNVYIADPASYENSTKEWDLQLLLDELKGSYDSGGPLWAVSFPGQ